MDPRNVTGGSDEKVCLAFGLMTTTNETGVRNLLDHRYVYETLFTSYNYTYGDESSL